MSTSTITHRPATLTAAAAVVAAITFGSVALSVSQHSTAPSEQGGTTNTHPAKPFPFEYTPGGGHTVGLP